MGRRDRELHQHVYRARARDFRHRVVVMFQLPLLGFRRQDRPCLGRCHGDPAADSLRAHGLRLLRELQPAGEPHCERVLRREHHRVGRAAGADRAAARGALGPRDRRGVQPGRDGHRVCELRRAVPDLGRVERDVPQDVHGQRH